MTATRSPHSTADLATVARLARQLRVDSIRASTSAGSGHPTSSMSAADLLAVLVARHLRYDWEQPKADGQRSPDLLQGARVTAALLGLQGRRGRVGRGVDDRLPALRVPSAGPPDPGAAVGRRRHRLAGAGPARRCGCRAGRQVPRPRRPSECGCCAATARWRKARCGRRWTRPATISCRISSRSSTSTASVSADRPSWAGTWAPTRRRAHAFGARVLEVDGHDLAAVDEALSAATRPADGPTVILARTIKGRGFSEVEDREGWHGKALPADMAARAIAELGGESNLVVRGPLPAYENPNGARSAAEARPDDHGTELYAR